MNRSDAVSGKGNTLPPAWEHVLIYFLQGGKTIRHAKRFFDHFSKRGWTNRKGMLISNWKVAAWQWIWHNNRSASRLLAGPLRQ